MLAGRGTMFSPCLNVQKVGKAAAITCAAMTGALDVSRNKVNRTIVSAWLDAAVAAGYPWTDDYNQEDQEGVGYFQMTMRNGVRCSSAAAYLKPVMGRQNLHVFTHAHSHKINIKDGRAVAVQAIIDGRLQKRYARAVKLSCVPAPSAHRNY